jgi:hypothetical protein
MYAKGIEEIQKSYGEDPNLSPELAYIYATTGNKSKAQKILERLQGLAKRVPVAPPVVTERGMKSRIRAAPRTSSPATT